MNDAIATIAAGLVAGLVLTVLIILFGFPLMLLWNWLMPTVFGLPTITFWQAVGFNLMGNILFKSHNFGKSDK